MAHANINMTGLMGLLAPLVIAQEHSGNEPTNPATSFLTQISAAHGSATHAPFKPVTQSMPPPSIYDPSAPPPAYSQPSPSTTSRLSPAPTYSSPSPKLTVVTSTVIGNITDTSANIVRDLGWYGRIGDSHFNSYGDTLLCADQDQHTCMIFASNTVAFSTMNPLDVTDFNTTADRHLPTQFCPFLPEYGEAPPTSWGMGISNIVQLPSTSNQGVLFFTRNYRPPPSGQSSIVSNDSSAMPDQSLNHVQGAGVALVDASLLYPVCLRQGKQFWDAATEPLWGDHGIVDGRDGYLYAFGEFVGEPGSLVQQIFLARVPIDAVARPNAELFEYWNGAIFTQERLRNPSKNAAVLPNTTQGSIFWSQHHNAWISLTRSTEVPRGLKLLTARTAPNLWGPWSDETEVYDGGQGAFTYAPVWHPEFGGADGASGKVWWVSFTGLPNIQEMVRIEFA